MLDYVYKVLCFLSHSSLNVCAPFPCGSGNQIRGDSRRQYQVLSRFKANMLHGYCVMYGIVLFLLDYNRHCVLCVAEDMLKYNSLRCSTQVSRINNLPQKTEDVSESPHYIIVVVNMLFKLFPTLVSVKNTKSGLLANLQSSSLYVVLERRFSFSHKLKLVCKQLESEAYI
ncbi:hypothetical protein CEXT_324061 [Caerostris extrusa]|uniref:Uncharacterized protein n=1 Tax=Caerostris extrusa TaxID=172846 RepID=A0AAV4V6F3_CAEEX|nr:hypothetical protein CEXT_324061 [Caerostris extrusa]